MPRTANGTYVQPANTAAVSGQTISSVAFNTLETDIGSEITNSVDRLGRGTMEANLNLGGYLINNVGTPLLTTDGATKGYVDTNTIPATSGSVTNSYLATAPQGSVKGTYAASAGSTSTVTITIASPAVVSWTGHGLTAGTPVTFKTTGALPTGISAGVEYYVIAAGLGANSFEISTTLAGSAVNTSGTQSGAHTAYSWSMAGEQDLSYAYLGAQLTTSVALTPRVLQFAMINNTGTPDTKLDLTAVYAVLTSFSGGNAVHTNVAVTINATTTGANALDTGTLAASTWYYVYLISTGSTVAGLISLSSTAPTLPAGYFYSVRVGSIRTDASIKFYRILQRGQRAQYVVTGGTNTAALPLIASGVAGNVTTPTWAAVSLGGYMPPLASSVQGYLNAFGQVAIAAPNNSYGGYTSTANPPPTIAAVTGTYGMSAFNYVPESGNIYWASNSSVCSLYISGYVDSVEVS